MNYDDANFGEIRRQLFYKKKLYGKVVYVIHRFYLSSKMCSCCGTIKTDLTLADRTYVCETCGMVKVRDLNAAINLDKVGKAQPEPTDACGHDGSVSVPHVTEATSMGEAGSQRDAVITIASS